MRTPILPLSLILASLLVLVSAGADESPVPDSRARAEAVGPDTVLLVTSKGLKPSWQRFAAWKTRLGKRTRVVGIDEIEVNQEGADIQEKIRACVQEYVGERGTRWVILGGDSLPGGEGPVPDRDTPHPTFRELDLPTDLYYLSPGDWDANDDGTYGEWATDRDAIQYVHPTGATIARIPVRTAEDVAAYTAKVIAYESEYPSDDTFRARMLYTCPEPHAEPKLLRSWDDHIGPSWKRGTVLRWFTGESPWDDQAEGEYDLTPAHWKQRWEAGVASKIHMHGHGFRNLWVLENRTQVDLAIVRSLAHAGRYPVLTTVSCWTGHYDAKEDPSVVEQVIRQPNGGAILAIAPSRRGVPVFHKRSDFRLMVTEGKLDGTTLTLARFWAHGLGEDLTAGEAFAAAKADMVEDARKHPGYHFVQCELNLLGDPTLDLRAGRTRKPRLTIPASIEAGTQALLIETDAPGAVVCVWQDPGVYVVVPTGEDGNAAVNVGPLSEGTLLVTVSGPSLNAALGSIEVQPSK